MKKLLKIVLDKKVEKSKAVAPIMPFNIYVGREITIINKIII